MNRAPTTYRQSSQVIPARAAATNTQSHHSIGFRLSGFSALVSSFLTMLAKPWEANENVPNFFGRPA